MSALYRTLAALYGWSSFDLDEMDADDLRLILLLEKTAEDNGGLA